MKKIEKGSFWEELLKKYIVIEDEESGCYQITDRVNFKKTRYCECYDNNGQVLGCAEAGCVTDVVEAEIN